MKTAIESVAFVAFMAVGLLAVSAVESPTKNLLVRETDDDQEGDTDDGLVVN